MHDFQIPSLARNGRPATLLQHGACEAYLALLSSQLYWLFPDFVQNLHAQSLYQREMGRVAVIEYLDEENSRKIDHVARR